MTKQGMLVLVLALGLSACSGGGVDGGGGGGPEPDEFQLCPFMTGSGFTVGTASGCSNCLISDEDLAIDGHIETYATLTVPALNSGTVAIRATAPSDTEYPALSNAGAVLSEASDGGSQVFDNGYELRTYYQGAPAGSTSGNGNVTIVGGGGQGEPSAYEFMSVGPYDAVEVGFTQATGTGTSVIRIHEFCAGD